MSSDAAVRAAVVAQELLELDPLGWYSFFGLGTWLVVMNAVAWKGNRLNRWHAISGILLGVGRYSTFVAGIFEIEWLNLTASGIGALRYPVYFIWLGAVLFRRAETRGSLGLV